MPVDFACSACQRQYRVKDELAGKEAKCQCGNRMKIPQLATASSASEQRKATDSKPTPTAAKVTSATAKPANGSKPATATAPSAASKVPAVKSEPKLDSWLDEELSIAPPQPRAVSAPSAAASVANKCPGCGAALAQNAVLCVSCGYDTRSGSRRSSVRVAEPEDGSTKKPKSKARGAASLMRGTLFSFIAASLGAVIWAVVALVTMREFGLLAWGLGGLVGFGMALGHEDDDGTMAGIIAGGMSLFGIVAAKFAILMLINGAISAAAGGEDGMVELQRAFVSVAMARENLMQQGVDPNNATEEQEERALDQAHAKAEKMTPQEIKAKAEKILQEANQNPGNQPPEAIMPDLDEAELSLMDLFGPIDGIFILLACATAYKVGSGKVSD